MVAIIAQAPIALHNPFCALESEFQHESLSKAVQDCRRIREDVITNHDDDEDGELDLSTWCVVNSDDDHDDEDSDESETGEIYLWQPPTAVDMINTTATGTVVSAQDYPLKLTSTSDGFTDISRATTAHSTNSASARALELRGAWVVKVSKKRSKPHGEEAEDDSATSKVTPAAIRDSTLDMTDKLQNSTPGASEKKRRGKQPSPTMRTVTSARDHDNHDMSDDDKYEGEYEDEDEDGIDDDEVRQLYMSMTEHELFKSSNATKIKNSHLATVHDHELVKALGCFSKACSSDDPSTSNRKKLDRKAIRSRSQDKKHAKAKSNNNPGHKDNSDLCDY
ncbi:MAG: hypothetical protein J3Q66DRAFT_346536 [Benniella sp.]|nr:MAG: hypothetical protein J3Q66DRAFT_346536 [Benniella sp.]